MHQDRTASVAGEPAATASAVVTLGHEVASLRDEMTSLAADVVLLATDQRGAAELERQMAALAAQCTDLPALRAVVARLEQDLEMRLQAPAPRLDRVVCELQAESARIADTARRALAEVRTLSVANSALEARLGMLEQRLGSWMDARSQSPLAALQELARAVVESVRARVGIGATGSQRTSR
jgi:chromosome segregation ATPase